MGFGIIGKEQIIEKWGTLISSAAGRGESVIQNTEQFLQESNVPDVKIQRRGMSPGVMRGIMGGKRPFVVITNTVSPNLKAFKMYLNARDYGSNLQVSWYVVIQPSAREKLTCFLLSIPILGVLFLPLHLLGRASRAKDAGIVELDIFDEQDLSAYVTNAHHCTLDAVKKLMEDIEQDFSKIDRQSRGFLGVS